MRGDIRCILISFIYIMIAVDSNLADDNGNTTESSEMSRRTFPECNANATCNGNCISGNTLPFKTKAYVLVLRYSDV